MTLRIRILSVFCAMLLGGSLAFAASGAPKASPVPEASGGPSVIVLPATASVCPKVGFSTIDLAIPLAAACGPCSDADCLGKVVGSPCGLEDMRCSIAAPTCATGTRCKCTVI